MVIKARLLVLTLMLVEVTTQAQITVTPTPSHWVAYQIPSDESVEKLMIVQQIDNSIEAENQQAEKMLQQSIANLFKETNVSPEKKANVQKIFQDFIEDSMKDLNNPSVKAQYKANFIATTKAIYNQQEVNAMIDFYSSPIGQQIVSKQDNFSANYMQRNSPIIQQWQKNLLKNKIPKLVNDLSKLKNPPNTK